jgi:MinD-like ATPase involved in chromosome partitioning or flagellar assembly
MSVSSPIQVLLSAPGQQALNAIYGQFLADSRLTVTALATTSQMLEQALIQTPPEVAVIDAELLLERGERGIVDFLSSRLGSCVAVVLLPRQLERLTGPISQLDRVREVLVKPISVAQVIDRCYQVGLSERVAREAMAPATGYTASALAQTTGAARAVALAGTRVFAVGGGKGGPGKTTVAVNLAYRLHQVGIRTLLMGFDTPDAVGVQLGLPMAPNSLNWYRRPTREGFAASLQNKDGLDVCLSPNDKVEASRVATRAPDQESSIARLVEAARDHHPPYAAIVMDLPPTESEWSVQPLLRANTVLLLCEPDVASQVNLVATVRLLTGVFDPRYQVPKEAIFAVLNRVTPEDSLTPKRMQEAIREQLDGWAPPFVAVLPADPGVRACQVDFVVPVTRRQEFAAGIDQIVDFFYRDSLGQSAGKAAGKREKSLFGIRVRLT